MTSTVDPTLPPLTPTYPPSKPSLDRETPQTRAIISHLNLQPHVEGGYFVETDRDPRRVPNPFSKLVFRSPSPFRSPPLTINFPFPTAHSLTGKKSSTSADSDILVSSRAASTTIHYYLTPASPLGAFHRNRGRTVHTHHRGRARYVIIHADEVAPSSRPGGYGSDNEEDTKEKKLWSGKARVETFVVGPDVLAGERVQWIVEGGKYKASFLLEDEAGKGKESGGCLISETVVPGFEFADHDFMKRGRAEALLTQEQVEEMGWMLRREE